MIGWLYLALFVAPVVVVLVLLGLIWRRHRAPTFKQISAALERDIAAAKARGVEVNETDRIAPRKRIRF